MKFSNEDKASLVTLNPLTDLLIDIARAGMNEPARKLREKCGRPYTTQGGRELLIKTDFVYPPIPIRSFDYMAYDDLTYDPDPECRSVVGWGATEEEAVRDLINLIEDEEEDK